MMNFMAKPLDLATNTIMNIYHHGFLSDMSTFEHSLITKGQSENTVNAMWNISADSKEHRAPMVVMSIVR